MKKLISTVTAAFMIMSVFAVQPPAQSDQKAADILKSVSTKYKSLKSVKATFKITVENPKDKSTDTQNGTICLKGNKYRLEVAGQDVISDGKTRWTYVKDANEVQVDNQRTDE